MSVPVTDRNLKVCVDRPLTAEQRSDAAAIAIDLRPDNVTVAPFVAALPNAIGLSPPFAMDHAPQVAVLIRYLWPNGQTIRVRFLDGETVVKTKVAAVAREWSRYANISLDFVDSGQADVRISFREKGSSWSYIGVQCRTIPQGQPTMNYGWLTPSTDDMEYSRVVLHEFGHALGAIHEHQNPRAQIPWDAPAVYAYYARTQGWSKEETDVNLLQRYSINETNSTAFDAKSIMLYAIPEELTIGTFSTGWNRVLSEQDKAFMGTIYPKVTPTPPQLTLGGDRFQAALGEPGEIDTYRFTVDATGLYVMTTEGSTDVTLSVWGPGDESALRGFDDNAGRGSNARVVRKLQAGSYWLKVRHATDTGTGAYDVGVRQLS